MLAGFVLLVPLGAACSGGSSPDASPTTVAADPGSPTTIRYRGDRDSAFCRRLRAGIPEVVRAGQGQADPAGAWAQARAVRALLLRVARQAPEAVRSDVNEVVVGLGRILDVLDRAGGDPQRIPPDQQAGVAQGGPVAAAGRLQAYARQVCGRPLPFLPG